MSLLWLIALSRITPAHAGKSLREVAEGLKKEDHPRTRGEKICPRRELSRRKGSPPHTRGKVCQVFGKGNEMRITPAHAGKRRTRGSAVP